MLNKLKNFIEHLDLYELQRLKNLILSKSGKVTDLIDREIKKYEFEKSSYCAVCGTKIEKKDYNYTLIFGPEDFKKKASFCEKDCMEYFMNHIKNNKRRDKEKVIKKDYF
ncbi:MAG: hypothetical protein ACOCRX_02855 [Candidatus Woesearchaeota archaeon]